MLPQLPHSSLRHRLFASIGRAQAHWKPRSDGDCSGEWQASRSTRGVAQTRERLRLPAPIFLRDQSIEICRPFRCRAARALGRSPERFPRALHPSVHSADPLSQHPWPTAGPVFPEKELEWVLLDPCVVSHSLGLTSLPHDALSAPCTRQFYAIADALPIAGGMATLAPGAAGH